MPKFLAAVVSVDGFEFASEAAVPGDRRLVSVPLVPVD